MAERGPDIQHSLVDAVLICKKFLKLRHVIECGLFEPVILEDAVLAPNPFVLSRKPGAVLLHRV